MISQFFLLIFCILALLVVLYDAIYLIIPNWVSAVLIFLFVPFALTNAFSLHDVLLHIVIAGIAFGICFALFSANILGGGDAKYLPAVALWLDPPNMIFFFVLMSIVGGALAAITFISSLFLPTYANFCWKRPALFYAGREVSYGPAIAISSAVTLFLQMSV